MLIFRQSFFSLIVILIIRGDNIRKNIGVIILSIALALVFTKAMFTSYTEEKVMTSDGNIYLLQYGTFINKDVMMDNIKKLDNYLIYELDDKYYVHLGVFTKYDTALKMQKIFEQDNIYTYLKNDYLSNMDLINQINELDEEIFNEKNVNKIKNINNEILNIVKKGIS